MVQLPGRIQQASEECKSTSIGSFINHNTGTATNINSLLYQLFSLSQKYKQIYINMHAFGIMSLAMALAAHTAPAEEHAGGARLHGAKLRHHPVSSRSVGRTWRDLAERGTGHQAGQ